MDVRGLGWSGTRTDQAEALASFYQHVLGLDLVHTEPHSWVFELPDGQTGPVVGFEVTDLAEAVAALRAAGIELLGESGPTWQHFRGPDGNVYELVASVRP